MSDDPKKQREWGKPLVQSLDQADAAWRRQIDERLTAIEEAIGLGTFDPEPIEMQHRAFVRKVRGQ